MSFGGATLLTPLYHSFAMRLSTGVLGSPIVIPMSEILAPLPHLETDQIVGQGDDVGAVIFYGEYGCSECARLHQILRQIVNEDGNSVQYVFRHLPLVGNETDELRCGIAAQAAERQGKFWEMQEALYQHEAEQDRIGASAASADLDMTQFRAGCDQPEVGQLVEQRISEARSHGIDRVPTLVIRGKEYLGAWDLDSIKQAIHPPVAKQVKEVAGQFADWAAASGAILIVFAMIALIWRNSPMGEAYEAFWQTELGIVFSGQSLVMSLHHWVNDLLMALFFLVVGLELKRELISGELSNFRSAVLPAAAALGGMIVPAVCYLAFTWGTNSVRGWGVPMATDIAFTLGVLALLGSRVPTSMKVFVTALAVVDDLGAILILAVAYNHGVSWIAIGLATVLMSILITFNRARVLTLWPYLAVGVLLWIAVYASGLHATLAGVLLAATIPNRPRTALKPLIAQEAAGVQHTRRRLAVSDDHGADERERLAKRVQVIDRRLNPPAARLERQLQPWSSYFVLPVFALANAGVAISISNVSLFDPLSLGIIVALVFGKPIGILLATWLIDSLGVGDKPRDASWSGIFGVGLLCGIGFTMSIFISSEAFDSQDGISSAKFAVMIASLIAAFCGAFWLRRIAK